MTAAQAAKYERLICKTQFDVTPRYS
jgi:hypothetical protein